MTLRPLLMASLLTLMACPTPPTPNNSPNSTPSNNAAPQPNNSGNGGPTAQGGNGNAGGPPVNGAPNNGGADNPGQPQGGPPVAGNPTLGENAEPIVDQELKVPSDEEIEKDGSIMGVFNDLGGQEIPAQYTQASVKSMDHVTLAGTITCNGDGCDVPFILRITPSFQPSEENGPLSETMGKENPNVGGTITSKEIGKGGGDYEILVPKDDGSVVIELLMDEDGDGKASLGEKFVIYEGGGGIGINTDRTDLNFEFSPKKLKAPLGGAKPPGEPGELAPQ